MSITITQLIAAVGEDNVTLQQLDQCVVSYKARKHGASEAAFLTDIPFDLNGFEKRGIIVWMDRQQCADAAEKLKADNHAD